jgi:hypothetical protein
MILKSCDITTCIHCHQILEEVINIAEAIQLKQDKD